MNLYELDKIIQCLINEDADNDILIQFYLKKRLELLDKISTAINERLESL